MGIWWKPFQLAPNDYYKHETHHFYHAGPPRVYQVQVSALCCIPRQTPGFQHDVRLPTQTFPKCSGLSIVNTYNNRLSFVSSLKNKIVQVPVTRKPVTVHVPQNVPVNFVPVHVPTQDLGPLSVVELDPFGNKTLLSVNILGLWLELDNIIICVLADHYGDPYVKRKELVKGALLLGTGMIKVNINY